MGYLVSIIVFQTLFTLMLIMVTRQKTTGVFEKLLTMLLLLMSVHFSIKLIFLLTNPNYFTLPSSFSLVYGPVVYLLTISTTKTPKRSTIITHFLPFIIMSVAYVFVLIQLHAFPLKNNLSLPLYNKIAFLDLVSIATYNGLSLVLLRKNKLKIDPLKFKLLKSIALLFISMVLLPLFFILLEPLGIFLDTRIVYIFILAIVVCIAIYKVKLKELKAEPHTTTSPQDKTQKYNSSNLSETDLNSYQTQLERYFNTNKPYLEPELTLQILSIRSGIPKHHITQVLNTRFHKNFYQFVNEFRVREVISKMSKHKNVSLVDLAYQCGFNSKSTFNNYFKKITGFTPSEYKKQHDLAT